MCLSYSCPKISHDNLCSPDATASSPRDASRGHSPPLTDRRSPPHHRRSPDATTSHPHDAYHGHLPPLIDCRSPPPPFAASHGPSFASSHQPPFVSSLPHNYRSKSPTFHSSPFIIDLRGLFGHSICRPSLSF